MFQLSTPTANVSFRLMTENEVRNRQNRLVKKAEVRNRQNRLVKKAEVRNRQNRLVMKAAAQILQNRPVRPDNRTWWILPAVCCPHRGRLRQYWTGGLRYG